MLVRLFYFSAVLVLLQMAAACDSDNTDDGSNGDANKDGGTENSSDAATDDAAQSDAAQSDATEEGPFCGDGIVQEENNEICDDANFDDNDGCTSLCELSCESNDDCDDLNSCNGTETCNDQHFCDFGEYLEDGAVCGPMKSCYADTGLCRDDVCGDSRVQGDEECDDGDLLNDNGCTTECEYSCETDEECTEGDTCAGSRTCDTETHTCTGDPKKDKTSCDMLDSDDPGWCMKGVCVPENCGNEELDDGEQCDEGLKNGDKGSGCSLTCKTMVCGNGKLEEGEQCDDGNNNNYDGCDNDCQVEFWIRWTTMNVLKEPSPDWCVNKGKNQFGNAFPGNVRDPSFEEPIDVLQRINLVLNAAIGGCFTNQLYLFQDSVDFSFRTSDDDVYLTLFDGVLEDGETCETPMDVDTRFYIASDDIDVESEPVFRVKGEQRPGVYRTVDPVEVVTQIPVIGRVEMRDVKLVIEVDTDDLSKPAVPSTMDESMVFPERMGFNDEDETNPSGRLCGSLGYETMTDVAVNRTNGGIAYCCKMDDGTLYDECQPDEIPDQDCDSFADIMEHGCQICDFAAFMSGGEPSCDTCDIYGLKIMYPTPPDIDSDNDGKKDAFSIVIGVEGIRVGLTGVREPPQEADE